jgi:hypothetical protein
MVLIPCFEILFALIPTSFRVTPRFFYG